MSLNTVVSIGGGWQQEESIIACLEYGLDVVIIEQGNLSRKLRRKCKLISCSFNETDFIFNEIRKIKNLIGAFAFNNEIGQILAEKINCEINSIFCRKINLKILRNKFFFKDLINTKEINVPRLFLIESPENIDEVYNLCRNFTVIVKPNDSSGSRGISLLPEEASLNDFKETVNFALKKSRDGKAIIEEFIFGDEYSVEGYVNCKGTSEVLKISRRELREGTFSASSIYNISEDTKVFKLISAYIQSIFHNIEIKPTLYHIEVKVNDKGVFLIDVGFRGGGYFVADFLVRESIKMNLNLFFILNVLGYQTKIKSDNKIRAVSFSELAAHKLATQHEMEITRIYRLINNNLFDSKDDSFRDVVVFLEKIRK